MIAHKQSLGVIYVMSLLVALSWSQTPPKGWKGKIEVVGGVQHIHNTENPLHPELTVTFTEDLSLGGEDQEGNVILFRPGLPLVDENENIYIKEIEDLVIKVFGPDGKYIKTIGAKGQGPGEFQGIKSLAFLEDGKLMVLDSHSRRTSFFNSSGQFLRSFQWKTGYLFSLILLKSSSYIICEGLIASATLRTFNVKEVDFEGKVIRYYDGNFVYPEELVVSVGNGFCFSNLPVSRGSEFIGDQDKGIFYHCVNDQYSIEVYDSSGKLFRKIDRPYEPVPFTKSEAEEYRAGYKDFRFKEVEKTVRSMKMPKVKSIVSQMYVDDKSNLWIETNERRTENDKILTAFDIFNPDGYYYAKIWTEFTSFLFKKGKMYRMETNPDTGYKILKRYKIVWE